MDVVRHFASVVSSDGEVIVKPFPFENSRQGFMKLIEEIENFHDCLIGLESTGHYARNLIYFLYERGYQIGVINPIQTDALRDSNIRKTKTDNIVLPELPSFFKGNLHLKVSYALIEKYLSAKAIAHCRIDGLTNLLYSNSRGRYNQDKALQLKELAKQILV